MSQIKCSCGQVATIHVTEIVSGEKQEIHLCEECAKKKKILFPSVPDLSDYLTGLIEAAGQKEDNELNDVKCARCGLTFADFRSGGRLGCPSDYDVFRKGIDPLLERIHGTTQHRGKVPAAPARKSPRERLAELRGELKKAVAAEAYERAARLRDQIYALKKEQGDAAG
jgi:protein arginine kinase activator